MVTSGLGWTDSKKGGAVGGLAREFFHRLWVEYQKPERWTRQERANYQAGAQPGPGRDDKNEVMWTFEPHVAEFVFEEWLKAEGVPVYKAEKIVRTKNGVEKQGGRILSFATQTGKRFTGKMFIDAGYEGDLMAGANVAHRTGRDSADEWGEPLNGIRFHIPGDRGYTPNEFPGIDPYKTPGDPKSGLIAGVESVWNPDGKERVGASDFKRLQSFNYRLCLTQHAENRAPFVKPENYKEADYELLLRLFEKNKPSSFTEQLMPNLKTDSNNQGPMSLDFVGGSFSANKWTYSDASDTQRDQIALAHRRYTEGYVWTIQNHPRVPQAWREKLANWGWAKDEFVDNGHFPYQMYVREARRMDGLSVMTQHHVQRKPGYEVKDSIGLGSYSLDSHVVRRVVVDGNIKNEGGFYVWWDVPYPISYGAIVPKKASEAENLLVPVTLSATHAAFGSIRMEPTYMLLGQAAATAAVLALDKRVSVQAVSYADLSARLRADKQILDWENVPPSPSPV